MTEKEIQLLGFEKNIVPKEESGENRYHYYTYEITKGLELISCESDNLIDGKWYVEFFDTEVPVRFFDMIKVQVLINTLERAKTTNK